ncbi:hypothetical protein CHS0354_030700 [Potamilus streckersoni]|uniref:Uncharacterized protein n=1 Tax=Potamilus streckersoni TaxID=2493646 RepID=A0AAE0SN67_9BIVA|nr:hypothetical protein CHS0354_030700 [Potamilus streckersoni]
MDTDMKRKSIVYILCCVYILILCMFRGLNEFPSPSLLESSEQSLTDSFKLRHLSRAEFNNMSFGKQSVYSVLQDACSPRKHTPVQCSRLIGDAEYVRFVRNIKIEQITDECRLENLVKDCTRFKISHGYSSVDIQEEERLFPLSFTIKMHQNPDQAEQLLRTIYRPHNFYCIYVDGKSPVEVFETMKNIGTCLDNVVVVRDRVNVVYASSAHFQAELQCMKLALQSQVKWKYYINMAAQEFPLRTTFEMVQILTAMREVNDIETYDLPVFLRWRLQKSFSIESNGLVESSDNKRPFEYDVRLSKGSAYGLFTRKFVEFILEDDIAQKFILWLNDTYAPEENMWATLVTLPWAPGSYPLEVRHTRGDFLSRAMIWYGENQKCHGKFVRGVCVFESGDLPWLIKQPNFFANKFDVNKDATVIDCLEEVLKNRTMNPKVTDLKWQYYLTRPHVTYYRRLNSSEKLVKARDFRRLKWLTYHLRDLKSDF